MLTWPSTCSTLACWTCSECPAGRHHPTTYLALMPQTTASPGTHTPVASASGSAARYGRPALAGAWQWCGGWLGSVGWTPASCPATGWPRCMWHAWHPSKSQPCSRPAPASGNARPGWMSCAIWWRRPAAALCCLPTVGSHRMFQSSLFSLSPFHMRPRSFLSYSHIFSLSHSLALSCSLSLSFVLSCSISLSLLVRLCHVTSSTTESHELEAD